jgi:hypothetical protein
MNFCNKHSRYSLYGRTEENCEQHTHCTYNVTLWSVRIISKTFRLSWQPYNISREKRAVMAIWCHVTNKRYLFIRVKCPIFFPDRHHIWIFSTIFIIIPNTKCHGTPSSCSRCGTYMRTDGPMHMTKVLALLVTMRTGLNILGYPFSWLRF